MGLVPLYQVHMVSADAQAWQFSYPGYETRDRFFQLDFRGRLYLHPRWLLSGQLPYRIHQRMDADGLQQRSGVGDAQLLLHRVLWRTMPEDSARWQHLLQVGLGAKAPTGAYSPPSELGLPAHFNLGTGAWDALGQLLYQTRVDQWGLAAQAAFRWRGTHGSGYRFGDVLNGQVQLFRVLQRGRTRLTPRVGMAAEQLGRDVQGQFFQEGTGGVGAFGLMGIDLYWRKRLSISLQGQLPLVQNYAEGAIRSQPRLAAQIQFFIM